MQPVSVVGVGMVDVPVFPWRRRNPAPQGPEWNRQSMPMILDRLETLVDRLNGAFGEIEPLLNPQQTPNDGNHR